MQNPMNIADAASQSDDAQLSAVSWPAIFAGGLAALALSLALLVLGSGLGFAAMSPWSTAGASAAALTLSGVIWLIVMQWASAGVGGYITGRLRTRWTGTHPHEVFFRDTAHGLLAWALATVLTAALLASVISSVVSGGSQAAATANMPGNPVAYYVDGLFRQDQPTAAPVSQDIRAETSRILMTGIKNNTFSDNDKAYLAKLIAAQTGLSPDAAAQRVDAMMANVKADETKAREAADVARKASASLSIFTALSMFIGAFIACLAAALGGNKDKPQPGSSAL